MPTQYNTLEGLPTDAELREALTLLFPDASGEVANFRESLLEHRASAEKHTLLLAESLHASDERERKRESENAEIGAFLSGFRLSLPAAALRALGPPAQERRPAEVVGTEVDQARAKRVLKKLEGKGYVLPRKPR